MFTDKQKMIDYLELKADTQRTKFVIDPARAFEYQEAERQALEYKTNNYTGPVPTMVESGRMEFTISAQESADNILYMASIYRYALSEIRRIRLSTKTKIKNSSTIEEANLILEQAIVELIALEAE